MRSTSLRSRQRRSFPHIAAESLNLRRRRLLFEPLEDRRVLAGFTFTVNSPDDNPSGPSPGIVTLRDAINALNSDSVVDSNNPDLINFAIPGSPIISLAADLPALAKPVVISGSTQAGVTVSGNGFAMVVENSGDATLEGITFTGAHKMAFALRPVLV